MKHLILFAKIESLSFVLHFHGVYEIAQNGLGKVKGKVVALVVGQVELFFDGIDAENAAGVDDVLAS